MPGGSWGRWGWASQSLPVGEWWSQNLNPGPGASGPTYINTVLIPFPFIPFIIKNHEEGSQVPWEPQGHSGYLNPSPVQRCQLWRVHHDVLETFFFCFLFFWGEGQFILQATWVKGGLKPGPPKPPDSWLMVSRFSRHDYLPHVLFLSITLWFFEGRAQKVLEKTPE